MKVQFYDILTSHTAAYPNMKGQDYSCLAYESEFGREADRGADSYEKLVNELNSIKTDSLEPMTVKIGGEYSRVNLAPIKQYLSADVIHKMMEMSSTEGEESDFKRKISLINKSAKMKILPKEAENASVDGPFEHSSLYKHLYGASYRVVSDKIAVLTPALCLISEALSKAGYARVGIDGTTASGKTDAAEAIRAIFEDFDVTVTEGRGVLSTDEMYEVRLFFHTDAETRMLRLFERGGVELVKEYDKKVRPLDDAMIDKAFTLDCDMIINT